MANLQFYYKLALIFFYSFFSTHWILPYILERLKKYGYTAQDKYKKKKQKIPRMGGIAMLGGTLVALSLSQIFETLSSEETFISSIIVGKLFVFYFIVIIYALYGIIDDLFSPKKRYDKILVILGLSFPIAFLITDTQLNLFLVNIELGVFYSLILAPVYIMVVANLINLHSGYNGLAMGTSWLIMVTLGLQSYLRGNVHELIFLLPALGSLTAFLPYNIYPARLLEGNTGSFLIGGTIGAFLIAANMELFGIFILIPHIINFILDTWTIAIRKRKDVKFGSLRSDGTIKAPASMRYKSLKFLLVTYFRLTEKKATNLLWGFTFLFCISGLILFR